MWPLIFEDQPAIIYVDLYVTSIINVNEKDQSLTTQVKTITAWPDSNMKWDKTLFCGMETFVAPKNMFWTPDIGIIESIKTEFGTKESPYVKLIHLGVIASSDILALTTACRMDLYRFPFDSHSCNITLQSTAYSIQEIRIIKFSDTTWITIQSKKTFHTQGEWELISINVTNSITNIIEVIEMDQLIYQITIKRRPLFYVINFMLPVFFFLVLDVMSFFIDGSGTDKLSFKVTLLLSISVFLLILNDTLPSTADKIPLIGIFCSVIFSLIGISLLETILVNFLKAKGAKKILVDTTATVPGQNDNVRDPQSPPDSVKDQNEQQGSCTLDLLKQILTECCAAIQQNQQKKMSLCWTRVASIIDVTFLVLYIFTIIVFLSVLGKLWLYP
ncbi:5-hydroxytryptamine receptor 3A-like [Labeo rohita]|uniref:5-hydroxytryptamine receptor 3A-like n=1 Tax=Labeo rohita TaxID=84645 RepID=UPI0021E1BF4C|nr:5-hydroxytryptamine receptor 3A-like [Labeo rohita]